MKYTIISMVFILFAVSNAQARVCYLSYDSTGLEFVDCRIGASPYTRICIGIEGERVASDYKVEILTPSTSALNIGGILDSYRDWSQGDTLAPGESIDCSIDDTKKQVRLALAKDKRDVADAIVATKTKRRNRIKARCASLTGYDKDLCEEVGGL